MLSIGKCTEPIRSAGSWQLPDMLLDRLEQVQGTPFFASFHAAENEPDPELSQSVESLSL